jgi:hypothetical protein
MDNAAVAAQIVAQAASLVAEPAPSCPYFKSRIEAVSNALLAIAAQVSGAPQPTPPIPPTQ